MKSEYGDIGAAILRLVGFVAAAITGGIIVFLIFVWLLAQIH